MKIGRGIGRFARGKATTGSATSPSKGEGNSGAGIPIASGTGSSAFENVSMFGAGFDATGLDQTFGFAVDGSHVDEPFEFNNAQPGVDSFESLLATMHLPGDTISDPTDPSGADSPTVAHANSSPTISTADGQAPSGGSGFSRFASRKPKIATPDGIQAKTHGDGLPQSTNSRETTGSNTMTTPAKASGPVSLLESSPARIEIVRHSKTATQHSSEGTVGISPRPTNNAPEIYKHLDSSVVTPESVHVTSPLGTKVPSTVVDSSSFLWQVARPNVASPPAEITQDPRTELQNPSSHEIREEHLDEAAFEEILSLFRGDLQDSARSFDHSSVMFLDREVDLARTFSRALTYGAEFMDLVDDIDELEEMADDIIFDLSNKL